MTNSLPNSLWKPATTPPDGKYENLVGKQLRLKETKEPIIIETYRKVTCDLLVADNEAILTIERGRYPYDKIEYLDDSDEAVKALFKEATKDLQYKIEKLDEDRLTSYSIGRAEAELDIEKDLYTEKQVRDIIDITWNVVTESTAVPSTVDQTRIILKLKEAENKEEKKV
jgi:hypothetical protein